MAQANGPRRSFRGRVSCVPITVQDADRHTSNTPSVGDRCTYWRGRIANRVLFHHDDDIERAQDCLDTEPNGRSTRTGRTAVHGPGTKWARMGTKKRRPIGRRFLGSNSLFLSTAKWLRGQDLNLRPLGYEPNELPDCSTSRLRVEFYQLRLARTSTVNGDAQSVRVFVRLRWPRFRQALSRPRQVRACRQVRRRPSARCHRSESPS